MLIDELNRMFADVVYPGDKALAGSYPNEWESTLRNLQGKDWRTVASKDFDSQGGIIEGVQVLGLKAFIYFLPGLIRICLTDSDSRYDVAAALLTRFTVPDYLSATVAAEKALMAALSPARRSFLVRFFSSLRETEPTLCPIIIDSAVFNLKVGDIIPYKHEDVKQWASQSA
jgi:hypothetical protein